MKLKTLNYQRNGICGNPFYTATFNKLNDGLKGNFVATFETDENDKKVDGNSCRVIDIDKPFSAWRGDRIASEIQDVLKDGSFYDLLQSMGENEPDSMYYKGNLTTKK